MTPAQFFTSILVLSAFVILAEHHLGILELEEQVHDLQVANLQREEHMSEPMEPYSYPAPATHR